MQSRSLVLMALMSLAFVTACDDSTVAPADPGAVVSRVVDEPPGANCAEGGTAVQSGLDADDDGELDDDEVETTVYVCRRDRVRIVAEPPGEHCADGGTAVWVGDDANGDDTLDESEVRDIAYLCEAAHELVTRFVEDAPAAPCANGSAIEAGLDLNDDGTLDDDEVMVTEYVCGIGVQGYLSIDTPEEAEHYRHVRVVLADLSITDTALTDLELPDLWFVGGTVWALENDALTSLRLPSLYKVGGGFAVSGNPVLAEVALPELHRTESVTLFKDPALTAFDIDFADILFDVVIRETGLQSIDWVDVGIWGRVEIRDNPSLTSLTIESENQIGGDVWLQNNDDLADLDFSAHGVDGWLTVTDHPALAHLRLQVGTVDGDLRITNNPALTHLDATGILDYRGLYHVLGNLVITGSPIADVDVGYGGQGLSVDGDVELAGLAIDSLRDDWNDLERVGGALNIHDNPGLHFVRVHANGSIAVSANPVLEGVLVWYGDDAHAGFVRVNANPQLDMFDAVYLNSVSADVSITNNPLLTWHGVDYLRSAGSIWITDNASLPTCSALDLFTKVNAGNEYESGNDDAGTCN
jgi:hypothetical protein